MQECKHNNASYQPSIVDLVLERKLPDFDRKILTHWFGEPPFLNRKRVLDFKLQQCRATLELIDALDIIGRAGEAARLSNVEFDKSFPGIRGSQYEASERSDEPHEERSDDSFATLTLFIAGTASREFSLAHWRVCTASITARRIPNFFQPLMKA